MQEIRLALAVGALLSLFVGSPVWFTVAWISKAVYFSWHAPHWYNTALRFGPILAYATLVGEPQPAWIWGTTALDCVVEAFVMYHLHEALGTLWLVVQCLMPAWIAWRTSAVVTRLVFTGTLLINVYLLKMLASKVKA